MNISFKYLTKFLYNKPKINIIILFISKIGVEVSKVYEVFYKFQDKRTIIDYIINLKFPTNKYYLMNHYRLGKELNLKLTLNHFRILSFTKQKILNASYRVGRIYTVLLKHFKIVSSPVWLKIYLNSLGYKTVNSLIDIMYFFKHEFGVKFLILDCDKFGDKFITSNIEILDVNKFIKLKINKKSIMLNNTNVLFYNRSVPVSILGLLNNKKFILNKRTKRIIMLAYILSPIKLYEFYKKFYKKFKTNDFNSSNFNSYNYNQDPFVIKKIIIHAIKLIKRLNNCKIYLYDQLKLSVNFVLKQTIIYLRLYNLYKIIGGRISYRKIESILIGLEFQMLKFEKNSLKVLVPLYRTDINIEADLIGEILRIYGYDTISFQNDIKYESNISNISNNTYIEYIEKSIYYFLISNGYNEVINLSLIDKTKSNLKYKNTVKIINTKNKHLTVLRYTIIFGMIQNICYNINRNILLKINDIKLFEFGKIYINNKVEQEIKEIKKLGLIYYNKDKDKNDNNFFLIKGITEQIIRIYGLKLTKQKISKDLFADRSLKILYKKKTICKIGKINTNCFNKFKIKGQVFYSEINLSILEKYYKNKYIVYKNISKFPGLSRDISLIINAEFCFNDIKLIIKREYRNIIKNIILLEEYINKKETKNVRYYTIRIFFQHLKKTLTAKLINLQVYNIKEKLKTKFQAVIR
ncbi:phenylalanine--tRNA ligase subunit beta-related protein [Candidatus Karelsulcia muelleri]